MNEAKVVNFNNTYGNNPFDDHKRKVVFHHSSREHITITAVDPLLGIAVEVMIKKADLPEFVTNADAE
jgi:hypothetical protein